MMRKTALLILITASVATTSRAELSFDQIGDPELGGSWFQSFQLRSSTSFNNMGIILTDPSMPAGADYRDFLYTGFKTDAWDFGISGGTSGWRESSFAPGPDQGYMTAAAGTPTNELVWRSHFIDEPETTAFTLTLFTYDSIIASSPIGGASATWDGISWKFDTPRGVSWNEFQQITHAPEPTAALLGSMGLFAVGFIRRRASQP